MTALRWTYWYAVGIGLTKEEGEEGLIPNGRKAFVVSRTNNGELLICLLACQVCARA
jgi:hypothetical protein